MRNLWLSAAVISDLLGVAVAMFDRLQFFAIIVDLRVQALVSTTFALGIWLSELVISLLTVVQVFRYLLKRSVATAVRARFVAKIGNCMGGTVRRTVRVGVQTYSTYTRTFTRKLLVFIQVFTRFIKPLLTPKKAY